MKTDEKSARLRAHRNNIYRYSGLLATHLSDLERAYIEGRLREERASMEALMKEAFPFTLPAVQCAAPNTAERAANPGDMTSLETSRMASSSSGATLPYGSFK